MSELCPCPAEGCAAQVRVHSVSSMLRPGLYDCPCRRMTLRYWREGAPFGGSLPRLRVATPEEIEQEANP